MEDKPPLGHLFGGTFLVAGTSIGAGMLALPIVTSLGGFFPSCIVFLLCWAFMTCTGLLMMELCVRMNKETNIISLVTHYLGRWGQIVAWILYLFLFYSLSVAYISGGGGIIHAATESTVPLAWSILLFVVIFGGIVYCGAHIVDRFNWILIVGLVVSYMVFVIIGIDQVHLQNLNVVQWSKAFLALPVIFTSFGFQGTVPTLTHYMRRNVKRLRFAIICGTTVALIIYILWQILILGIVPLEGVHGLSSAKQKGINAIEPLKYFIQIPEIYAVGQFFAFFAITTSFFGVTLGLFDFLADGLKLAKKGWRKVLIALLTFGPPTIISYINPNLFLIALGYAGGVGVALLLGLLPTLMVWSARYRFKETVKENQLPGGRFVLCIMIAFVIFELIFEVIDEYARLS